ncbi:MAG: type transport system ATP-binding protein [Actinomycetota bacterium]
MTALDGVTFDIEENEVLGLLGPNGAGKTTLVKILATLLLPSSGHASVFGHDVVEAPHAVRPLVGIVLGGERGLYYRLTARQNLRYWAALYHLDGRAAKERTEVLLTRVGLDGRADEPVETFSRGMKQRLHLARGLIGDPRVIFFDEPTTGMDPVATSEFRQIVRELHAEGRTILLATHDMDEAETLCDRVALIDNGRLVAIETPRTLSQRLGRYERIDAVGATAKTIATIRKINGVADITPTQSGGIRIHVDQKRAMKTALGVLVESGVTNVSTSLPSLEEVYVNVFGERGLQVGPRDSE